MKLSRGAWFVFLFIVLFHLIFSRYVIAQSFDRAIKTQLNNNCSVFLNNGSDDFENIDVGLGNICGLGEDVLISVSSSAQGATPVSGNGIAEQLAKKSKRAANEEGAAKASSADEFPIAGTDLSGFLRVRTEWLERDDDSREDGYESEIYDALAGVGYQFNDWLFARLDFNYWSFDGDFESGGDFENDSYGILASTQLTPTEHFFVNFTGGYWWKDLKQSRRTGFERTLNGVPDNEVDPNEEVRAKFDGSQYGLGIHAAYEIPVAALSTDFRKISLIPNGGAR